MPHNEPRVRIERGLYRAGDTYYASVTPPGARRPRFKSLGKVTLTRARDLRDEFAVEVRTGRPRPVAARRATFSQVADQWLDRQAHLRDTQQLAPRTYDHYESATRLHLKPFFRNERVRAIGPDRLVEWVAQQRAAGYAPWSVKGRWTALRLIFGHATRTGIIDANPADSLERRERPSAGEARQRFLAEDEMARLLNAASPRWRPLVAVGLFGGLRLAEVCGLVWQEIDFDAGMIRVRHQLDRKGKRVKLKTGAGRRDVVLMPQMGKLLAEAKLVSVFSGDRDPVLATGSRRHVSLRNATRAFQTTCEHAGFGDVSMHALRHTFASILISQGHDPVFVADQLGHADPAVSLRIYGHLFRAARQADEARAQLESQYAGLLRGAARSTGGSDAR